MEKYTFCWNLKKIYYCRSGKFSQKTLTKTQRNLKDLTFFKHETFFSWKAVQGNFIQSTHPHIFTTSYKASLIDFCMYKFTKKEIISLPGFYHVTYISALLLF